MKNIIHCLFGLLILSSTSVFAQESADAKPFIEMTGTAEIKVDPDQIFISILLQENLDKDKKTITQQEQDLIKALQTVGIAKEKLVVTDANAYYGKSGFMTKDVVNRKKFELEVKNATQARKAFEQLDLLHISRVWTIRRLTSIRNNPKYSE